MPSIKWHYLLLSYFPLSSSCAADMQCTDRGQSREAHQHIYGSGRWGLMMMTMELWSSHWKIDWFAGVSSTWLESEFLLWAAVKEKTLLLTADDECCAVNWLLAGMLMWLACKKTDYRNCRDFYLLKDLLSSSYCNNRIPSRNLAFLQVQ